MKVKLLLLAMALTASLAVFTSGAQAAEAYNYISPEAVAKIIRDKDPGYAILDIQLKENFDKQHLRGAIPTYAFPGNKPEMHEKLKAGLAQIKDSQKIVVVCPRGGGGAKNTIDYYRSIGVSNDRLLILEKGQDGWPKTLMDVMANN